MVLSLFLSMAALSMPLLTVSAQEIWKTDWSPDGTKIVFGIGSDIWMIGIDDGVPVNLTEAIDNPCYCPVFAPDSGEVVYSVIRDVAATGNNAEIIDRISFTEAMNPDTKKTRLIKENAYAAEFSPDGRTIVYIRDWTHYALYDIRTKTERIYETGYDNPPYFCSGHCDMSPDNRYFITRFVYSNNAVLWNRYKLYRVAVDTGEAEFIDIDEKNYIYPKYSPDGSRIAVSQAGEDEIYRLVIYDLASAVITHIDDTPDVETKCGSWSPDGSRICYIKNTGDITSLYIYDIGKKAAKPLFSKYIDGTLSVERVQPLPFMLFPNYPNPFNPQTTIAYRLDKSGRVSIDIFSVHGQKIRRLYGGFQNTGSYSILWNGRDDGGNTVSSGVYICRLTMGEQVTARQLMLVR